MSLKLNPFAMVTETSRGFMICISDRHRVMLPAQNHEFVSELIRGTAMTPEMLSRYISQRRLRELLDKGVLLNGNSPPVQGRYSRQLGFFSLTSSDYQLHQGALSAAHAMILGAGGVGSHVAWNLAAMGVGRITVVDFDLIEESNLNRQLYTPADIGQPKVEVLCERLATFNPQLDVRPIRMRITSTEDIAGLLTDVTVLVKAIDTPPEAPLWANEACVKAKVPNVAGGFVDELGVVGPMYVPGRSLCLACVEPPGMKRLHGTGPTFAPVVTLVASMISLMTFKIIVGETEEFVNKIYSFDTRSGTLNFTFIQSAQTCGLCGHPPSVSEAPQVARDRRLAVYRLSIFALMLIGWAIVGIGRDRFTGLLTLALLFASLPVIDIIVGGDPRRFRREAFVISCMYVITNLVITGLSRLPGVRFSLNVTIGSVLSFVQTAVSITAVMAVIVTFLFVIMVAYGYLMKKVSNSAGSWFA